MVDDQTAKPADTPPAAGDGKTRQPMYGDERKILDLLERIQSDARQNSAKQARDRADLLNLRMERGGEDNQWIVWDGSANNYVTRPTNGEAGLPEWFFRATSNHLATTVDGTAAILNQSQPAKNWYHTRDDDESRAAAEVAEMADPVLLEEMGYPRNLRPRLNKLITLTNLAALVVDYDLDPKHGTEGVPILQCQQCGALVDPMDAPDEMDSCPDCGGQLDWANYPDGHPQAGQAVMQDYPRGKMHAELLSSFETAIPRTAAVAHEDLVPWVSTHQRWTTEEAVSRWPQLKGALSGSSSGTNAVAASSGRSTSQVYADQTRSLSAPITPGSQQGLSAQTQRGPVIWRFWHDPLDDDDFYFPQGLYAAVLEGEQVVLEKGPLPYADDEGKPFKNVLIRQYAHTAGSQWGKPPADDLVPLQKQLNLAQSLAFLILMHNASPRTFIPSTVTLLQPQNGAPGKDVQYRSLVPGDKPHVEPGQSFPEGLKWFIEFIIQMFEKVSKLNAVLLGQRPEGDPTLGEVEILQERGMAAFAAPLEQLVEFERRLSLKTLWIARESAWAPRFARLLGENGDWKLQQFNGALLEGHYTLDIETTSAWPKSPMLSNLRLGKAIELGIINPQDPEVQDEYLRLNDLQQFKQSIDEHQTQVARQLSAWREATDPSQIAPPQPFWKLDLHLFRKSLYLVSEEFEQQQASYPMVAQAMIAHVQQIQQMLAPPPAPAPPQKGDQGQLAGAVASGALKPKAPAGPKGSQGAMTQAVQSGALKPKGGPGAKGALTQAIHSGAVRPKPPVQGKPAPPAAPGGIQ